MQLLQHLAKDKNRKNLAKEWLTLTFVNQNKYYINACHMIQVWSDNLWSLAEVGSATWKTLKSLNIYTNDLMFHYFRWYSCTCKAVEIRQIRHTVRSCLSTL